MERINIIGGGNATIQYAKNFSKETKVSKTAFRISKVSNKDVVIHLNGKIEFFTKMSNVTIQENNTSPAIQLTPDNWDSLTNGLTELAGGGSGTGGCDVPIHNISPTAHQDIRTLIANLAFVKSVAYNSVTGDVTFTYRDNSTLTVNILVAGLVSGLSYDAATKELVIAKNDGTTVRVSVADLVDTYTGYNGTHIQTTVTSGNVIQAVLKAGTVTETELAAALLAKINGKYEKPAGGIPATDLAAGVIPVVNNGTLTIKKSASDAGTSFSANQAGNVSVDLGLGTMAAETAANYRTASQQAVIDNTKVDKAQGTTNTGKFLGIDALGNVVPTAITQAATVTDGVTVVGDGSSSTPIAASAATKASLLKADTAYQKPASGIPSSDMTSAVQASLGKADTALQSVPAHNHTKVQITDFAHTHPKAEITDFPATMTPSAHTHVKADITDFAHTHTPSEAGAAPANASLAADTGTGTDITTPAVASNTIAYILQTVWSKIRQLGNVIASKYTKPSTGIPASDLATGVIPDVSGFLTAAHNTDTNAHSALFGAKEPSITAGTTAQYWRGDKTWQTTPTGLTQAQIDYLTFHSTLNIYTSLTNIPMDRAKVVVNTSTGGQLSLNTTGLVWNQEVLICVNNTSASAITISFPTTSPFRPMSGSSVSVPTSSYVEISILCVDSLYRIAVLEKQ